MDQKGSRLEVKKLYNVGESDTNPRWSEYDKAVDENIQVKKKQENFAVVDYVARKTGDSQVRYESTYIQINSPQLKEILQKLFEYYPGVYLDVAEPGFAAPFHPFFHQWDGLLQLENEEKDPMAAKTISLLIETLTPSI